MEKQIIDIAYEVAVEYGKNPFTFAQLWKDVIKKARLDKEEQEQAGYIYTTMLQDNRFIFVGDSKFVVAKFLTEDEQRQHANALYDFKQEAAEEEARIKKLDKEDDYVYQDDETDEEYGQNRTGEFEDDETEDEEEDGEEDKDNDEPIDENEVVAIDEENDK